ncbi:FCD domain-containing protein [Mesorhizobium sp. CAU 1732]|uniref:FadR/GntR family transcriptional regulator n=1 Tax=Mesorhizobium sp. CAU 1732 TaxID=3140358 RepID=UPI003260B855
MEKPDAMFSKDQDHLIPDEGQAAFTQLQAFLAQHELSEHGRLPPERELCDILGVSRGALRKALAIAESEGRIWRHVGKGTFLGSKPIGAVAPDLVLANLASPVEVIRARLTIEPALAREAALNASTADLDELKLCAERGRDAGSWRRYENWDNRFHRAVATATQNKLLVMMFDNLNTIRRTVVWGRRREATEGPAADHHSFAEHDAIVDAIMDRDPTASELAMRQHIETVSYNLLRHR